ncbi:hypothetical protein TELCIR_09448 [Teladorsagia circumcincta]|uniref:Uncharacterized protein n=1 Tax=Teladorsagia circumcincta TaxID=45464 RepID=A0A2G9UEV7_TELCI|nr:hypothetical protein TELCIR_09448 [Teladorsagia circumcincta]
MLITSVALICTSDLAKLLCYIGVVCMSTYDLILIFRSCPKKTRRVHIFLCNYRK